MHALFLPLRPAERPPSADSRKESAAATAIKPRYFLPRPSTLVGCCHSTETRLARQCLPRGTQWCLRQTSTAWPPRWRGCSQPWWRRQQTELESAAGDQPAARAGHRTTNDFPQDRQARAPRRIAGGAMTAGALLDYARRAHAAGLCVLPPREDGSKQPEGATWEQWASGTADDTQARRLVRARPHRHWVRVRSGERRPAGDRL